MLLAAAAAVSAAPGLANDDGAPATFTMAVLAVTVNREVEAQPAVLLRDRDGRVFAAASDFARWRLRLPAVDPVVHGGERYYALAALPGLVATVVEREQTLVIAADPAHFDATRIDAEQPRVPLPARSATGAFLNYTVLGTRTAAMTSAAAALEFGAFGRWGVLTSTGTVSSDAEAKRWTRLETQWAYAMPERLASVRVGDAISRAGSWGNALRFGGVQLASDFATNPALVLSPGQLVAGQATVPSTVDVFVNNALVAQQPVRPGPFTIANIAPVTGSGNVTLVVRDELGREQVITRPFYASATMLRAGLADYSCETGWLRRDFGIASDDYGPWFASATLRRGVTDQLTAELRAEAEARLANVGVGADVLVGDAGVASASIAAGHNPSGRGTRAALGFERRSLGLSFSARGTWASPRFRQLGDLESSLTLRREALGSVGYNFGAAGTVSLAYVARAYREQPALTITSLGYSVALERWGYLGVSLARVRADAHSTTMNVLWTVPFGNSTSASAGVDRLRGPLGVRDERSVSVQRDLPSGEGIGWRLRASDHGPRQAELDAQNRYGAYSVEVAQVEGRSAGRVAASGGIGAIGDTVFFSRAINDSFGVVRVGGYADVRVYAENQEIGRTDAAGTLVVPRLLPYQYNAVRIEQADLPLDAEFERLTMHAVPYARSGVVVDFAVRPARAALVRIVDASGAPVPAGATVRIDGAERSFPVALDGEAYLTGLAPRNRVRVSWRDGSCAFDLDHPQSADPQPRLGPFVCGSVQ